MNNPMMFEMLVREQNHRIEEEIRNIQLLNAAEYHPLGFLRSLPSWISRFPGRNTGKSASGRETSKINQPQHG